MVAPTRTKIEVTQVNCLMGSGAVMMSSASAHPSLSDESPGVRRGGGERGMAGQRGRVRGQRERVRGDRVSEGGIAGPRSSSSVTRSPERDHLSRDGGISIDQGWISDHQVRLVSLPARSGSKFVRQS